MTASILTRNPVEDAILNFGYNMSIFLRDFRHVSRTMKNVEHEEWVSRSRFIHCPVCKNHTLKLKRVVQIGRCKNCSDSYKIITIYVKAGAKTKKLQGPAVAREVSPSAEATTLPSWQVPSDSSLFGASSGNDFSLPRTYQRNKTRSTSG